MENYTYVIKSVCVYVCLFVQNFIKFILNITPLEALHILYF
jgi:hypothetical protein